MTLNAGTIHNIGPIKIGTSHGENCTIGGLNTIQIHNRALNVNEIK